MALLKKWPPGRSPRRCREAAGEEVGRKKRQVKRRRGLNMFIVAGYEG